MPNDISLDIKRYDTRIAKSRIPVTLAWIVALIASALTSWWLFLATLVAFVILFRIAAQSHEQIRWVEQMKYEDPAFQSMQFLRQHCWHCVIVPIYGPYIWHMGHERIVSLADELAKIHQTQLEDGSVTLRNAVSK